MRVLLLIFGILSILYCLGISVMGHGTRFFLIWGVIGVLLCGLWFLTGRQQLMGKIPAWFTFLCKAGLLGGVLLFIGVELIIFSKFGAQPTREAKYCIVLGAQWKKTGPSVILKYRLDTAVQYLKEHPDTIAIVSGGQGSNEIISEAQGMKEYLCNAGIAESRILTEDRSTSTVENLLYSADLMDNKNDKTVIITNDFHLFRALKLAKKQGYQAEGLSAGSVLYMLPNNMLREFLGVLKDLAYGNM